MCGIIGFIGINNPAFKHILQGLLMLQNRGYDSAGIATINQDGEFTSQKYASENVPLEQFSEFEVSHDNNSIGIGHTRWATHGAKNDTNSHPHFDNTGRIAVVHNGIIENYFDLKKKIEDQGITLYSQTDTEVIANLISLSFQKHGHMEEAIADATTELEGTWGLVVISLDKPDNLYCARHGSPLLVGFGGNFLIVTSEQAGFSGQVNNYLCLNDGDIAVLRRRDGKVIYDRADSYDFRDVTIKLGELTPDPYPHWTIKEINEQYQSSIRATSMGARLLDDTHIRLGGLAEHTELLKTVEHLILLGCGTSYYAGLHSLPVFKKLSNFTTVQIFDGAEFDVTDIPKTGQSAVVLLSQSGETLDLVRCLQIARDNELVTIGVVNVVDSLIARETHCGVYLNAGREVGVASTKSFTSQVIVLSMIATWFAQIHGVNSLHRRELIDGLRQLHQDIKETVNKTHNTCRDVAQLLLDKHGCFLLGRGSMEAIGKEGSLKLKEIGYIHAEGYSAAALKHGTFALLGEQTPVIFINPDNEHTTKVNNCIEEVHLRNSPLVGIVNSAKYSSKYTHVIRVPNNKPFAGLLSAIPLQLISYELALLKGHNPDKPRNLAKVVTVE